MAHIFESSHGGEALIIDNLSLRRAGLFAILEPWARSNSLTIGECQFEELQRRKPDAVRMAIIGLGNCHLREAAWSQTIQSAQQSLGAARLAIIGDSAEFGDLVAAFEIGVHAYIPSNMEPAVALQALSFVLVGGSYFPPSVLLNKASRPTKICLSHERQSNPRDGTKASRLTMTQLRVVKMLSLGKTNKLIARDLEVCEATVKAHLRLLMKRLGLSSRTQVALYFTKMNPTEVEGGAASDDTGDDSELEGGAYAFMPGAGRHWHGVNVHA
jgi:DNA-binding NarL/FixJ family response regulator